MKERRKTQDRRRSDMERERNGKCSRRTSPDRRLNNINAVWIPINHIFDHPLSRDVFNKH